MKRLPLSVLVVAFMTAIYLLQDRFGLIGLFCVRPNETDSVRWFTALLIHGSALHVAVNAAAFLVVLYGYDWRESCRLLLWSVLPAALGVRVYADWFLPSGGAMLGSSPVLFALLAMICWRERRTSKMAFLGINRLAVPTLPALGIALAADALIWSSFKYPVAWELHTIAALFGLALAVFISLRLRVAVAAVFLACAASVLLSGCSSLTIEAPNGTVAKWRSFEPFRERDTVVEYDPDAGVFRAGINRTDTLTPEKIEAFGRGMGGALAKGIVPVK